MRVRVVALALALAWGLLSGPLAAEGQPAGAAGRVPRIGLISNATPTSGTTFVDAFRRGLADLGWIEQQNLRIEYRWAEGDLARHPRLMAELATLKVDVIVLAGTAAGRAAMQATRTIPIVVALVGDPVAGGLVKSLAKPGGNLTGLAWQTSDLVTKQLQLLQETVPRATQVAAIGHPANPAARSAVEPAARSLGVQVHMTDIGAPADIRGRLRSHTAETCGEYSSSCRRRCSLRSAGSWPSWPPVIDCLRSTRRGTSWTRVG